MPLHLVLTDEVFLIFHSLVAPRHFGGKTLERGGGAVACALHFLFGNFGYQAVKVQLHAREGTECGKRILARKSFGGGQGASGIVARRSEGCRVDLQVHRVDKIRQRSPVFRLR